MHEQEPPIIHRDLKVENCLLTATGFIQLCDFGSATTKVYLPDETWSVKKRDYVEDEMTKVTTPMYRAPEMLDTYNNYPINEQVDIWVSEKEMSNFEGNIREYLGIGLFTVLFMFH